MSERITVTFGKVFGIGGVNFYHQAIVTYSNNGVITVTQAGPTLHPSYEKALTVLDTLGKITPSPWGSIRTAIDQEVEVNTEQTNLPSVQVISGENLFDVGKIISYNAGLIQQANIGYHPTWQNSNSFVNTLLGSVGLSVESTYWSPADDVKLSVPGMINLDVDAAGQVDHGFHQAQPSVVPSTRTAGTPVAGVSPTGMRSESTEAARAAESARQAGIARTSNVFGYGSYRSEGPMAEAAQRAGMTGGRFPGKDQDDRDMARPDANSNTQYSPDSGFLGGLQVGPSQKQYSPPKAYDFTKSQIYSYTKYTSVTKTYKAPDISEDFAAFDPNKPQIYSPPNFKYTQVVTTQVTKFITKVPAPPPPKPLLDLPQFAPPPTPAPRNFFEQFASWLSGNGTPGASEHSLGVARDAMARGATPSQAKALAHKDAQAAGFDTDNAGWNAALDRMTGTSWSGGNGGGTRGSGNTGGGSSGMGGGVGAVGDHAGNNRGNDHSSNNGWGGHPVLLDLTGNGLTIDGLGSSSRFVDLAGDGYEHRTAWAGDGNGVLVFDADGDGKISRSSEFIFTEWDKSETSDLRALKKVFDTNGNGKLDAGDTRWADFKVMVGDQLVSLDSLGITSIDLTPKGSGQSFEDGSAITGTTTYTKSDGTTGQVGDAVLSGDENGYTVKRTKTTNSDGSTTEDLLAYNKDGSLAFCNLITTGADGSHKQTKFDDDGNGTFDRSQTVDLSVAADGTRTRVVANFNSDGSLLNKTTTITSSDRKTITILIDQDGDGRDDQSQIFVSNADGSTSTTVKQFAVNGALLKQTMTTSSADGLTKVGKLDETGSGIFNLETSEVTVVAADGSRTKTVTQKSADGTLISRVVTVTSADGRSETIDYDRAGGGVVDEKEVSVTATGTDGSVTNTVTSYNGDGSLRGKTIATTSTDGLAHTLEEDLDSDGLADRTTSGVTVVAGDGSRSQTVEQRSGNGSLLSKQVTTTSADRKTITLSADINGDGATDQTTSIVVDANGVTTKVTSNLNSNGSLITKTQSVSSADGFTQTTDADLDGDGVFDLTTTDVTILNGSAGGPAGDGSRTQTVQHYGRGGAATGTLLDKTVTTVSQDSLTKTIGSDLTGDGNIDRIIADTIVLNGDNSRTETVTSTSNNGTKLAQTVTTISADRKTTTFSEDLNGDNAVDRSTVTTVNADGSKVTTVTDFASNGSIVRKSETNVSGNGLTSTSSVDLNGDGYNDQTSTTYTVINNDGSRTTTSKEWAGTTQISQSIVGTSANGLAKTTLIDLDSDQTFDTKEDDFTVYNADGSTTRTITHTVGTSAIASRKTITTSANGLSTKVVDDLDGDGSYDRVTTDVKQLGADGSTTETIETWSGNNARLSKTTIAISADKKTSTTTVDIDGNGTADASKSTIVGSDGVTTTTEQSFSLNGALTSSKQTMVSANGLTTSVKEDWNGDGTYERTTSSTIVLNADGSRTETVATTSTDGSLLPGKVITTTSASGLSKVEQVDLTGEGVVDRTTSTSKTLGLDGSETITVETRTGNGTVVAKSVETTSADRKTRTTTHDDNGDGAVDHTVTVAVGPNGSTTTTAVETAANGTVNARKQTEVSADGLTTKTREDFDGNGTYDKVTIDQIIIGNDGTRTRRITEQLGSSAPTLVDQSIKNANGYEETTEDYDRSWLENRKTEKTEFNSDGTITTTVTNVAGPQAVLVDKSATTISANGLVTTIAADPDGNGVVDRTSTTSRQYVNDGSIIDTVIEKNGSGANVSTSTTTTSADKRTTELRDDFDGNGNDDEKTVRAVNADGFVTTTTTTFAAAQNASRAASSAVKTVSADGFTTTVATDVDGNGTVDRKVEQKTVYNLDGSKTETWSAFNALGTVVEKSIVATSANGLTTTTGWMATGSAVTRAMSDVTTLEADGGKTRTVTYTRAGGALESKTITTVSGNGLTTTTTKDIDGNGVVDQKSTTTVNADGSVTIIYLDLGTDGVQVSSRKIVTQSANGLVTSTDYDTNGDGTIDSRIVETTVLNADGSQTTTITRFSGTSQAIERTIILTSADGKTRTESYDLNADGTIDKKQTFSTAFGAHSGYPDAKTDTIENVDGTIVKSRYQTSTSADGKSMTNEWDIDGNGTIDQTSTETTSITDQGTVHAFSAFVGGAKISGTTTTTSNDGRTVTIQEERSGAGFSNRTIIAATAVLADGSTIETKTLNNTTNNVLEKQVAKTSSDGREVTIERDIDGNGTVDQTEQRTKFVDGSSKTVVTTNGHDKTTFTTSADGLSSTVEWDTDLDGTVDRRRVIANKTKADGSQSSVATDYKIVAGSADTRIKVISTSISADGLSKTVSVDTDGDGVFDQIATTKVDAGGTSVTTTTNNAEAQKAKNLVLGEMYWKQAIAAKVVTTVSSDGLTLTEQSDYDGNGTLETTAISKIRIDGSIVTEFTELNASGGIVAKGTLTVSNDGRTKIFSKDADNNGTIDHTEKTEQFIDGTVVRTTSDYNTNGTLKQSTAENILSVGTLTHRITWDGSGHKTEEYQLYSNGAASESTFVGTDEALRSAYSINKEGKITSGTIYDPKNTDPWTRVEQTYTSDGTKVSLEKQFMDDGTRAEITYDPANAEIWTTTTKYYDTAGRLIQNSIVYDDGRARHDYKDATNANAWTNIVQWRSSTNALLEQYQFNDNGTKSYTVYDVAGTQSWKDLTYYYDTAERLVQYDVTYDDNTKYRDYRDPTNASTWSLIVQHFNAAGQQTDHIQTNDDGTSVQIYYDPTNAQNYSVVYYYVDTAGRVTNESIYYDDGTRYYDYRDAANAQSWNLITQYFDSSNRITAQNQYNDDGSKSGTAYDATNANSWYSYTVFYNSSSQYYQEVTINDDGTRIDIWQGALVGQPYKTYQQNSLSDGRIIYTKYTNYNNTYTTNEYDVYNQYTWTRTEKFYSSDNVLMTSTTYYDTGAIVKWPREGGGGHGPVILDLNRDGNIDVQTLSSQDDLDGPRFDWNGDGAPEQTSWAGAGDAFLAIDLAADGSAGADGVIDQAKELAFNLWINGDGTYNATDLEALRLVFDTNQDSVFDSNDTRWNEFRVWRDVNQNGATDAGELMTLADAGVTRIGLVADPQGSEQFADGSEVYGTSWFETVGGTRNLVGDVKLVSRPAEPEPTTEPALTNDTGAMPANLKVDSLVAAMASFGGNTAAGTSDLSKDSSEAIEPWKHGQLTAPSSVWSAA